MGAKKVVSNGCEDEDSSRTFTSNDVVDTMKDEDILYKGEKKMEGSRCPDDVCDPSPVSTCNPSVNTSTSSPSFYEDFLDDELSNKESEKLNDENDSIVKDHSTMSLLNTT